MNKNIKYIVLLFSLCSYLSAVDYYDNDSLKDDPDVEFSYTMANHSDIMIDKSDVADSSVNIISGIYRFSKAPKTDGSILNKCYYDINDNGITYVNKNTSTTIKLWDTDNIPQVKSE